MNYKMKVTITDPNTKEGMYSALYFELDVNFVYKPEECEYTVIIQGKCFDKQKIIIKYNDKDFDQNNKFQWLEEWAKNYWSGEQNQWEIKALEIIKVL